MDEAGSLRLLAGLALFLPAERRLAGLACSAIRSGETRPRSPGVRECLAPASGCCSAQGACAASSRGTSVPEDVPRRFRPGLPNPANRLCVPPAAIEIVRAFIYHLVISIRVHLQTCDGGFLRQDGLWRWSCAWRPGTETPCNIPQCDSIITPWRGSAPSSLVRMWWEHPAECRPTAHLSSSITTSSGCRNRFAPTSGGRSPLPWRNARSVAEPSVSHMRVACLPGK